MDIGPEGRMCDWKHIKGRLLRSRQSGNLLCPKALVWLLTTRHLFVSDCMIKAKGHRHLQSRWLQELRVHIRAHSPSPRASG